MSTSNSFHLSQAAAENYETHSVPAMFAPLAAATLDRLSLKDSAEVLDVACGTGAVTREIAGRMGGRGHIIGSDLNPAMLAVAEARQPTSSHQVSWQAADVTSLPFDSGRFDYIFLQQGLQFFPDKPAALREIRRVLGPGGQLILTCWAEITPFNVAISQALLKHVGEAVAAKAKAPFSYRDATVIRALLADCGLNVTLQDRITLPRRFDDLRAQVLALPFEQDIQAAGPAVVDAVVADTARLMAPYREGDSFVMPQETHLFCCHP